MGTPYANETAEEVEAVWGGSAQAGPVAEPIPPCRSRSLGSQAFRAPRKRRGAVRRDARRQLIVLWDRMAPDGLTGVEQGEKNLQETPEKPA